MMQSTSVDSSPSLHKIEPSKAPTFAHVLLRRKQLLLVFQFFGKGSISLSGGGPYAVARALLNREGISFKGFLLPRRWQRRVR